MPKLCYTPKTFNADHQAIIDRANQVIEAYQEQGYDLTLRQLYYQFVSRDWIANRQTEYKRLGDIVSQARRAGLIDWEAIVDRTRHVRTHSSWDGPEDIVQTCAAQFTVDLWEGQDTRVEVWVEKDALVGVLQVACDPFQAPYFSCRGFTSDSELWSAAQRFARNARRGLSTRVLHLGDHDPSGIDMSRDIADRLELFGSRNFEVKRIALNMDQIEQYEPPPNPAKETDSRFRGYQEQYGDESWELDALNPETLTALIRGEIEGVIDQGVWDEREAERDRGRELLASVAGNWDAVAEWLRDKGGE